MTLKLIRITGSHPQHGKGLPGSETSTCEGSTGEVEQVRDPGNSKQPEQGYKTDAYKI